MPSITDIVENAMNKNGVPLSIWGPIMDIESAGNPSAESKTSVEDSVGLFQLNRQGGLGQGYTVAQLQDPALNASLASNAMAPAYKAGVAKGLSGIDLLRYVAYNSGWPTSAGVGMLQTSQTVKDYDTKLVAESNYGEGAGGIYANKVSSVSSSSIPSLSGLSSEVTGALGSMSDTQKKVLLFAGLALVVVSLVGTN